MGDDPGMCISSYNRAFDAETSKSPDERLGAAVTFSLTINQSTIGTLAIVCLSRICTVFNDIIVNSKLSLISTLSRQRCLPALILCTQVIQIQQDQADLNVQPIVMTAASAQDIHLSEDASNR